MSVHDDERFWGELDHLLDAGNPALAVQALSIYLDLHPESRRAHNTLAIALMMQAHHEEAVAVIAQVLAMDPAERTALTLLATAIGVVRGETGLEWAQVLRDVLIVNGAVGEGDDTHEFLLSLMHATGFVKGEAHEWMQALFETVWLPLLWHSAEVDAVDLALAIETDIYVSYVKNREGQAHFSSIVHRWIEPMRALGSRFQAQQTDMIRRLFQARPCRVNSKGLNTVVFFISNSAPLAHVEGMMNFLRAHARLAMPVINPVVISLAGSHAGMVDDFNSLGVEFIELGMLLSDIPYSFRYGWVKAFLEHNAIDTLVFISLTNHLAFFFGMRVAPVQVWWQMKYQDYHLPDIDGYLTQSHPEETFTLFGEQWYGGTVAADDWYDPSLAGEAARVRNAYPGAFLFGTLGREEKLKDPAFLDLVCKIVKAAPDARYLWTGRVAEASIQSVFEREGIADRCHFVGWVNTRVYAQVLDVFLDCFPHGCGYTLLQAMAASCPVVFMSGRGFSYADNIQRLVEKYHAELPASIDEFKACVAHDDTQYPDIAARFFSDHVYRRHMGAVSSMVVSELYSNMQRYGDVFARQMLRIREDVLRNRGVA